MNALEEGIDITLDFEKLLKIGRSEQSVVPVVLQDADSDEVLFVGFANEEALRETLKHQRAVLWSTSRNELWRKGDGSGDVLSLAEVCVNCEQNSLLYRVRREGGGACHTVGAEGRSRGHCYYRRIIGSESAGWKLEPR